MNQKELMNLAKELGSIDGQALTMPLPKRMDLEAVRSLKSMIMGKYYEDFRNAARRGYSAAEAIGRIHAIPGFTDEMKKCSLSHVTLVCLYMIMRHQEQKASLFTVNPALSQLLDDTGIKDNIPAKFFAPPYPTCFIEFDPAERRAQSKHITFSNGVPAICEGAMVQETLYEKLPMMSQEVREILELDPQKPVRMLEIGFSASPVGSAVAAKTQMAVAFDNIDMITIYIQDENESIKEILDRHFHLYAERNKAIAHLHANGDDFTTLFEKNFAHLTKILFYLNVEKGLRKEEKEASALSSRLDQVADKKKDKLKRQLNRVYDRIVIGPDHYTPIKELMDSSHLPKGTKSPHYRRGYFGIRWIGSGEHKHAELRRVSHSIINERLLKQDASHDLKSRAPKDYEIR